MYLVLYKLELSHNIARSVMLSGVDDICLVDCQNKCPFCRSNKQLTYFHAFETCIHLLGGKEL